MCVWIEAEALCHSGCNYQCHSLLHGAACSGKRRANLSLAELDCKTWVRSRCTFTKELHSFSTIIRFIIYSLSWLCLLVCLLILKKQTNKTPVKLQLLKPSKPPKTPLCGKCTYRSHCKAHFSIHYLWHHLLTWFLFYHLSNLFSLQESLLDMELLEKWYKHLLLELRNHQRAG